MGRQYAAPGIVAYTAAKFGVTGLTKAMACDRLSDNIRVNCICPGPTDTPLIQSSRTPGEVEAFVKAQPIGRLDLPQEVATAVLFLASDEASFITDVAFPVDGGQSAFPLGDSPPHCESRDQLCLVRNLALYCQQLDGPMLVERHVRSEDQRDRRAGDGVHPIHGPVRSVRDLAANHLTGWDE